MSRRHGERREDACYKGCINQMTEQNIAHKSQITGDDENGYCKSMRSL